MTIGFIILRHVNSKSTDRYWKRSYDCVRKFYPENEIVIIDSFTKKSAKASDTHNGDIPNIPIIGTCSEAHETSFRGSKKIKKPENAIKKKISVSNEEPTIEDINGAFHHFSCLK